MKTSWPSHGRATLYAHGHSSPAVDESFLDIPIGGNEMIRCGHTTKVTPARPGTGWMAPQRLSQPRERGETDHDKCAVVHPHPTVVRRWSASQRPWPDRRGSAAICTWPVDATYRFNLNARAWGRCAGMDVIGWTGRELCGPMLAGPGRVKRAARRAFQLDGQVIHLGRERSHEHGQSDHMRSGAVIPSRPSPWLRVRAVSWHSASRLSRTGSCALSTGQAS